MSRAMAASTTRRVAGSVLTTRFADQLIRSRGRWALRSAVRTRRSVRFWQFDGFDLVVNWSHHLWAGGSVAESDERVRSVSSQMLSADSPHSYLRPQVRLSDGPVDYSKERRESLTHRFHLAEDRHVAQSDREGEVSWRTGDRLNPSHLVSVNVETQLRVSEQIIRRDRDGFHARHAGSIANGCDSGV